MRTTIRIGTPILQEVKQVQKETRGSLGHVVSQLLSEALEQRRNPKQAPLQLKWIAQSMQERVDLADKEAIYDALDSRSQGSSIRSPCESPSRPPSNV